MEKSGALLAEYEEINQHLRSNTTQFVNWFSFFLLASFPGFGLFVFFRGQWPDLGGLGLENTVTLASMAIHALAGAAIVGSTRDRGYRGRGHYGPRRGYDRGYYGRGHYDRGHYRGYR